MKSYILLTLGLISLAIGFLFYGVFRLDGQLNTLFTGSFPSFIHVFAFALLTSALLRNRKFGYLSFSSTPWIWLAINIVFEAMQFFTLGIFDINDIIASFLGAVSAWGILKLLGAEYSTQIFKKSFIVMAFLSGSMLITGSVLPSIVGEDEVECTNKPIYMSYDELRASVKLKDKELQNAGKIYLYKQYLLINEPNLGVHVYDNETKTNPVKLGFINIPGTIDIAMKDDYLYVDSFIDLVVIDFKEIDNKLIREVNRKENVFDYDRYQVFSGNFSLCYEELDDTKGVIIGKY